MTDVELIVATVASGFGIFIGATVFFGLRNLQYNGEPVSYKYRRDTALMILAGCLSIGSILPQLIKNQELKSEMDNAISPFFPAISPIIIFARIPANYDLLQDAKASQSYFNMIVTVTTHAFLLIAFITWNFQYAMFTKDDAIQYTFLILGGIYSLLTTAYAWWVFHQIEIAVTTTTKFKQTDSIFSFDNVLYNNDADSDSDSVVDSSLLVNSL